MWVHGPLGNPKPLLHRKPKLIVITQVTASQGHLITPEPWNPETTSQETLNLKPLNP